MKILLCVDDDPVLAEVMAELESSVELSRRSEVLALHVVAQSSLSLVGSDAPPAESGETLMERVCERLSRLPVQVTRIVSKGDPAQEIVRIAESSCAELVVMGAMGERRDFLTGSVTHRVVTMAPTDVFVVRGRGADGARRGRQNFRALLAVDGSLGSEAGIDAFSRKLRATCASIRVVHVVESTPTLWEVGREQRSFLQVLDSRASEVLAWAMESLERRGLEAESEWRRGNTAVQILEAARETEADVIVVGSRGHSAIREMVLGGITHRVLRHAPCNVLCARGWAPESGALSRRWMSEGWEPGAGMA
ncbi:MAG: universal stress protein [Vicinamibacteria bacterium]